MLKRGPISSATQQKCRVPRLACPTVPAALPDKPAVAPNPNRGFRSGHFWCAMAVGVLATATMAPAARAEESAPHLGYVYPAGGRQGTTFQVTVGGQHLAGVSQAPLSGGGAEATVVEYVKPPTKEEAGQLRVQLLRELQKTAKNAEALKTIAKIRERLAAYSRPANPSIAEMVVLRVTIAPCAEPGPRELRLAARGVTNPLVFCVGQLPEFSKEAAEIAPRATEPKAESHDIVRSDAPSSLVDVAIPATLNGQMMPGGVDRYRFAARKGQQLVAAVAARQLIPYLADAVPGWFQPNLAIYDAQGNELAYADRYRFHPDPVLHCAIPADGQYTIEIRDALYRGREDFIYRITLGELPFLTGIFPLGGRTGTTTTVSLMGWNLPLATLTEDGKDKGPGVYRLAARNGEWISNSVPFARDTLPECVEQEPNDTAETAQRVTLPLTINGRIDRPGDWDVFTFEGRAGQQIVAEVMAPPAGFSARFRAQTDGRGRPAVGLQRRPRGQEHGLDHAPCRFLAHGHAAGPGSLLSLPRRCAAQGRPGICLPLAHQPAAARFRVAGGAVGHQRSRRERSADHLCPAEGRLFR